MEFPRQEYWTGLLFTSPGDLLYPGIEPTSPALAGGFLAPWEAPDNKVNYRVQKSVLYICVSFFCLAYRIIVNIFLNSIYMC